LDEYRLIWDQSNCTRTPSWLVAVDRRGDRAEAILASGPRIPLDLALVAVGVRPNVALAEAAGLRLGASGGLEVDQHQRTSDPAIYAAGDNSESRFLPTGEAVNVALAGPANKQGRVAGANAALDLAARPGLDLRPASGEVLGTAIVRAGGVIAGITGMSERRARSLHLDAAVTYVQATSHAGYYPGAEASGRQARVGPPARTAPRCSSQRRLGGGQAPGRSCHRHPR
jgi:NADPH-dependent 2,4-dienoyl-CoA reductase/sulfur reductase-like enzyme